MKKGFKILFCLLMLMMAATFVACSRGGSSDYLTITVRDDPKNIAMVEEMCDEFAKYYRNLYPKATPLRFVYDARTERSTIEDLGTEGEAGQAADVIAFINDKLGRAVESNLLAVNPYGEALRETNTEEAMLASTYNGTVYGYPITSESQILIYRKSVYSSSDVENIETILEKGKLVWDVLEGYYGFGLFTDAVLYGEDGQDVTDVKFDNEATIANIIAAYNLKSENLDVPGVYAGSTDEGGLATFLSGDAKAIIVAPYFWKEAVSEFGDDVAMTVLPKINGNQMRPLSGYKLYGVNRYSEHPAIAMMLANFLVSEECQAIRLRDRNLLPTNTNLLEEISDATGEIKVYNWRQIDNARITVPYANITQAKVFQESLNNSILMPSYTKFDPFWLNYADQIKPLWALASAPTPEKVAENLRALANALK